MVFKFKTNWHIVPVTFLFLDFCVEGLTKNIDFAYFVLIGGKVTKRQQSLKQSCKDLFILAELPIVWLIIESDNIFSIVNGAFAIDMILHNMLTQNRNNEKLDTCF